MRPNRLPDSWPTGAFSRRTFLQRASWFAAAVGAPSIIPASALGAGGRTPPSERINMGFIGLGGQGTGHLLGGAWTYVPGGYVARTDVQVRAVCDVRRERRTTARERCNAMYAQRFNQADYRDVQDCNDFREVLDRADIDAVLCALPYHWAAPMAIRAMRAGKDVYCEKPVAITVRQSQTIVETARRFGRIYQAGTQQRSEYGGKFRQACELIRNGRIGQLKEVYAYRQPGAFFPTTWTSDHSVPVPAGFDWDMWLGPLPWRPFGGEAGHTLSGLLVGDTNWSPHHYDIIQWTVNPDPTSPIEVEYEPARVQGGSAAHPGGAAGRPEDGNVHYHYTNGVVVHSTGYPNEPVGGEGGACFVGTEGRIAVDRGNIVSYPDGILKKPLLPGDERVYHADSHSGNFLECIRTRRPTICDPTVAAYTINAILIGGIAMGLQRNVRWDPVKLEFPGDETANRLLSYTPRPPWFL
ncbi:MAG: Gfo/Idh/MocA family oxidoreductase [Verrucomicrobiales bacterium]|nr:Gfo/Idh/MocA family oxidoreductase [Verrucomicrobiales bacterium]